MIDTERTKDTMVVTITPEVAKYMIGLNTKNRDLNDPNKGYLEHEMQNGNFKLNGESIIVSKTGVILDGQHRLLACINTGKSFSTVLVLNIDDDNMFSIDTGSNRSPLDAMKIAYPDEKYINGKTSMIIKILGRFEKKNKTVKGKATMSSQKPIKFSPKEVTSFYAQHKLILDRLAIFSAHIYGTSSDKLFPPASIGAMIYLLSYEEGNKIIPFMLEFSRDVPQFGESNAAKKTLSLFREEERKRLNGKTSLTAKVLVNYILNIERNFYRKGKIIQKIRNKKHESASFPEYDISVDPKLDEQLIVAELSKTRKSA